MKSSPSIFLSAGIAPRGFARPCASCRRGHRIFRSMPKAGQSHFTRKASMGAESHLEKSICDYARKSGFLVFKFSSPGHRAVPDRLFISPYGTCVFIEVKAPGKTPTPLQARELERLRDYNVPATWV